MPIHVFLISLFLCCGRIERTAAEPGVFDFEHAKAVSAFVTSGGSLPAQIDDGPMLQNLAGIIAELNARDLALLSQCVVPGSRMLDARGALTRIGVVHLLGRDDDQRKRVELLLSADGVVLAQELAPAPDASNSRARVVKLDPEKFRQLSIDWARYRGSFGTPWRGLEPSAGVSPTPPSGPTPPAPGAEAVLDPPPVPAPFFLDQKWLGDRFLSGRRSTIPGATRVLSKEKMFLRASRGYDPRRPAGLLVWINAADEGPTPPVFRAALDELNIVCVGIQNVGNDRPVADRYQLALDAIFSASAMLHVDPRRVYVSGISGGGRVSSMLQACFPDYFTGSVPIVGLSCYQPVPLGNSRFAPAGYSRPPGPRLALFKSRRMGAITGDRDFNQPEMKSAASIMRRDGLNIRLFEFEKFGHQMPSAEQFLDVLRWVDEPYQQAAEKDSQAADAILQRYIKHRGEQPPQSDAERRELVNVTKAGPWTPAAWRAADWLTHPKP